MQRIVALRGQKVLLDSDLAGLHGMETKRFNGVKRNRAHEEGATVGCVQVQHVDFRPRGRGTSRGSLPPFFSATPQAPPGAAR